MGTITGQTSHRLPSTPLTIKALVPHNSGCHSECHHFCPVLHTPVWPSLFLEIFIKAVSRDLSVDIVLIGTYRNDVAQSIWLIVPCSLLSMRLYTLLAVILRHLSTGGPTSNDRMDMREGSMVIVKRSGSYLQRRKKVSAEDIWLKF